VRLTAKQAPHRPGISSALGLRAGGDDFLIVSQTAFHPKGRSIMSNICHLKKIGSLVVVLGASAFVISLPSASETQSNPPYHFAPLGDLTGGTFCSTARSVSADGSVVVGYSNSYGGMQAFRWTQDEGMVGLSFTDAIAASADGSVVVGSRTMPLAHRTEPVRGRKPGRLQGLGCLAGCTWGEANGVNADGSVVVGFCGSQNDRQLMAFRWTQGTGIVQLEPIPKGVVATEAQGVSSDGEVVVGTLEYESGRRVAFRWTSTSGFVELGALSGDTSSIAHAVSADGLVVVGLSIDSAEAFRWTQETGMVGLGSLPGGRRSYAFGVSADGSVIVGQSESEFGLEAFVWDAAHAMRSLRELLTSKTYWGSSHRKFRSATAVSHDGSMVVGYGINPSGNREAWIARLVNQTSADAPMPRIARR
jgi:probable HAF family extracellular repeat protein